MKKLISLAMIFLAIGCVSGAPKGKPTYMPAAEAPAPPPPPKQRVLDRSGVALGRRGRC